ncbi:MAG: hypothetical protein CM15mP55_2630 [Hyphomicrobiales bacterium]|nr:MAG: hypothetical protein CM15mP55_2630 [Hyphomicrobiales bacterium]
MAVGLGKSGGMPGRKNKNDEILFGWMMPVPALGPGPYGAEKPRKNPPGFCSPL